MTYTKILTKKSPFGPFVVKVGLDKLTMLFIDSTQVRNPAPCVHVIRGTQAAGGKASGIAMKAIR
jgi:hypothetical protein